MFLELDLLHSLHRKIDFLVKLTMNLRREIKMADDKITALEEEVASIDTVVGSVETLVTNLVAELTAAKGSDERVQAVIDKLEANKTRLGIVVAANTAADPEVPPEEPIPTLP